MKELENMVLNAYRKMESEGKIEQIIENNVENTVTGILDDCLKEWSTFGKTLKERIEKSLAIDVDSLKLAGYNKIVLNIVQKKMDNLIEIAGKKRMEEDLEKLLSFPPETIKLSELVADFIEMKEEDAAEEGWESITLILEESTIVAGYKSIALHESPGEQKYRCDIHMQFDKEGVMFGLTLHGRDIDKEIFIGQQLYGFEKKLFQLYACKVPVIFDEEAVETYYSYMD